MEETEVPLRSSTDIASQMQAFMEFQTKGKLEKKTINTRHILFIVSGAFGGLSEVIKKRIGSKQIGFMGEKTSISEEHFLFEQVKSVDFIEYGFEAEFAGRLPVVIHCNPLSVDDLFSILKYSEGSILKQYKRDFLAYGIDVFFTDDGMRSIAENATEERTGARGLMSVCEKLFREFKYALPDSEVRQFIVDGDLVQAPQEALTQLLDEPERCGPQVRQWKLKRFGDDIKKLHGVRLTFTDEAVEVLSRESEKRGQDIREFAESLFADYEHALNLLSKSSTEFVVDEKDAVNPAATLDRWIKETYK
jgi:ATP-dependent protease Clp ATPase subunit